MVYSQINLNGLLLCNGRALSFVIFDMTECRVKHWIEKGMVSISTSGFLSFASLERNQFSHINLFIHLRRIPESLLPEASVIQPCAKGCMKEEWNRVYQGRMTSIFRIQYNEELAGSMNI